MSEPHPDPVQKFFGGALMAVGGLIALLSGTCTALFVVGSIASMAANPSNLSLMMTGVFSGALVVAIVGGLPTVMGILLFRFGRRLYRPVPPARDYDPKVFSDEPETDGDRP
jgi:hypothetical protein